jgi:hypothetical protein
VLKKPSVPVDADYRAPNAWDRAKDRWLKKPGLCMWPDLHVPQSRWLGQRKRVHRKGRG